jgi:hypothetical protein
MIGCCGGLQFRVDAEKARENLEKHGVSFAEASTAFGDPLSLNMSDPDHSEGEDRFNGDVRPLSPVGCVLHGSAAEDSNHQRTVSDQI